MARWDVSSSKPPPILTPPVSEAPRSARDVKPHDALFRRVFSDVTHAAGELQHALPEGLVAQVDWSTLASLDASVVDAELRDRTSDLVFTVQAAGREVLLYLLVEHQSRSDPMMGFRLLRYMVRLWEGWLEEHGAGATTKLPAIVPLVVHHSGRAWSAPRLFHELVDMPASIEDLVPRFRYLVDDLATQSTEQLAQRKLTALGIIALICLARARHTADLLSELRRVKPLMVQVVEAPSGPAAYATVMSYILHVTEHTEAEVLDFSRALGPAAEQAIMTGAEQLREEGRTQARAQERAQAVIILLEKRFGALSTSHDRAIREASLEQLSAWLERVLDVASVDELFES